MIDSIELINFQSHKSSLLEFHKGVNAIVGPSDNGKSAILRALYLARYNQPSGDAFVSKWARDEKGKQKKQMSVNVCKDKKILARGKGPNLNGYDIDGSIFEALGKGGLPQGVVDFFNTTDVNIQKQMDSPFLIGLSSADVAKFLNEIVDMSEIDLYLSAAESKKRANAKDTKRVIGELKNLEDQEKKFDFLDTVESMMNKLEKIDARIELKNKAVQELSSSVIEYDELSTKLQHSNNVDLLDTLLKKIGKVKARIDGKEKELTSLKSSITDHQTFSKIVSDSENTGKITKLLKQVRVARKNRMEMESEYAFLIVDLEAHKTHSKILQKTVDTKALSKKLKELSAIKKERLLLETSLVILSSDCKARKIHSGFIKNAAANIMKLEKQLPDICPTCKQEWHR